MNIFGALVKTAVNVALLPVAVVKDIFTVGGTSTEQTKPYLSQTIDKIKEDADY